MLFLMNDVILSFDPSELAPPVTRDRFAKLSLNSVLSRQFRTAATFSIPPSFSVTRTELMSIQKGQPLIEATRR